MARPRKVYVVWDWGRVVAIVEGLAAAKAKGPSYRAFANRLEAEEYAAWWDYAATTAKSGSAPAG